jgi:hypothetical protein
MKKAIIILLLLFSNGVSAQNTQSPHDSGSDKAKTHFYIGSGSGLNGFCGMAGGFGEIISSGHLALSGGAGISLWGTKLSGAISYYRYIPYGTYFSLSFSCLTGKDNALFTLSTLNPDTLQTVRYDLNTTYTINLALGYQFVFGERGRIFIELGYALPLKQNPYSMLSSDIDLTDTSKIMFYLIEPGGIMIDFGVSYRLF